jgi:hypothetical protein
MVEGDSAPAHFQTAVLGGDEINVGGILDQQLFSSFWHSDPIAIDEPNQFFSRVPIQLLGHVLRSRTRKAHGFVLDVLVVGRRARSQGRVGGRPKAEDDTATMKTFRKLKLSGLSVRRIAAEMGVSPTTIQKLSTLG